MADVAAGAVRSRAGDVQEAQGMAEKDLQRVQPAGSVRSALTLLRGASASSSISQVLLAIGVTAAVIVLGLLNLDTVRAGGTSLAGADMQWLTLAVVSTVALWVAGTITQFGSMPGFPPVGRVFAVQVAASFANHLLPAGSGGIAVNVRFLQRHGLSRGAAVGSVGLNSLVGLVTHVMLLAGAVLISPAVLSSVRDKIDWKQPVRAAENNLWIVAAVVGALALIALLVTRGRPGSWGRVLITRCRSLWRRLVREMKSLGTVVRNPSRAAALWLGSLSVPLLHGMILYAVLRSIGTPIAMGTAIAIYVVVSSLSAVIPSPGGIGALDVALVAAFAAVGVSSPAALAAVLGYRLLTVWVPLLPGACVFAVLLRRRII
ncbi:lysylphosphatidylglycerol synthase transmembrane domain-containing protein [Actinomadura scrupuli]|uniref:lysylphosphatidylglycerol synthase transmembrane domain-containing protein n=1 Tax=Actinomadura scrupuli TaxID=559629 RepID=UPI003D971D4E